MARRIGPGSLLYVAIAAALTLSGRPALAEPLRLLAYAWSSPEDTGKDRPPEYEVQVVTQVFAAMGQDVSFEHFPTNRVWSMVASGERDGMVNATRTSEREAVCSFPDEPLSRDRVVFFIRAADAGKLKFSSFDDLAGHAVAVREQVPGLFEQPSVSPELWKFLREHNNVVETLSAFESFRMLIAGRVDYAIVHLRFGMEAIANMGVSGKIEPLLSRSTLEDNVYVCFTKGRVSPAFVDDFSRALKKFKQTEAFQAIYSRFFP